MGPNLLFILADQFRADALGCVGGYARTPNLDALANRGWLFTHAYANSAECIPSRLSLATGLYPHQFGVTKNKPATLDPRYPTWTQAIARAGYRTSLFGKTHLHAWTNDLRSRVPLLKAYGFDVADEIVGPRALTAMRCNLTELWEENGLWRRYRDDLTDRFAVKPHVARPSPIPLELYYDTYVGRTARDYLRSIPHDRPWFCCVCFAGPHEPWDAPEPYASLHDPAAMPPPRPRIAVAQGSLLGALYESKAYSPAFEPGDVAALRANYAGNVSLIDEQIGAIVETVMERGELNDTVILFASDHGEMNGDYGLIYKANFQDPAIRIPFILVPPGNGGHLGARCDALVELMDAGATFADYAGAADEQNSLAVSLRPLIEGAKSHVRTRAISEFAESICWIDRELKCEFGSDGSCAAAFDRRMDPEELHDLSTLPQTAPNAARRAQALSAFMSETPTRPAVILKCEDLGGAIGRGSVF